jgi:hypothetical protein
MCAKNAVIAGDYLHKRVSSVFGMAAINYGFGKTVNLNNSTVESYEVITDEHRKSAVSGVVRGIVGGALLGPVGLLAGLSAKNKSVHTVAIQFKDGKKSLVEIDGNIYKKLIANCF